MPVCFMNAINPRGDKPLLDFYATLQSFVVQDEHPLTIRQLAVLLSCYLLEGEHTVRRLASRLKMAKPSISRILDHLVAEGLIERRADPRDRRSVLFGLTQRGMMFIEATTHPPVAPARRPRQRRHPPGE
jgi:DNA-binding MarR family transcriptional regulator